MQKVIEAMKGLGLTEAVEASTKQLEQVQCRLLQAAFDAALAQVQLLLSIVLV